MSDHLGGEVLLVGAGRMARAYAGVLQAQGREIVVIGRGERSATEFTAHTGLPVLTGGLERFLQDTADGAAQAIIATPVGVLAETCVTAIEQGVRRILVEKPAGLDASAIGAVAGAAKTFGAEVFVAYNRRFYASVVEAKRMIAEDGGVRSFAFEFTEFGDRIAQAPQPEEVKDNWLLANSTHVIDLAFFLGGWPRTLTAHVAGRLEWHRRAAAFAGAGVASTGALFSYHANWDAPGRWGLEVLTRARRLILRPLETLHVQARNSAQVEPVTIDDGLDTRFKPGLHRQVTAFVEGNGAQSLWSIGQQLTAVTEVYAAMLEPSP